MKYGRLDSDGKVVEIVNVESGSIGTKFHPNITALFEQIPEDKDINHYKVGGVWVDPSPSARYILQGTDWIEDPKLLAEEQKTVEKIEAMNRVRSNANSANSIPALRNLIKDIWKVLTDEDI